MTGKDIFNTWAPIGAKWVNWVRPVPFININEQFEGYESGEFVIPKINYMSKVKLNTAIIVDLPGNTSIKEGLAIAKFGFRPVPIYNGIDEQEGAMATVDNKIVKIGLIKGALELKKMQFDKDAPPVFLLDSNRMNRYKINLSVFDNSWDIYAQDIPSPEYFLKNGICDIIVRGNCINKDLNKVLYPFQKKGINIFLVDRYENLERVKLKKVITEI